MKRLYQRYREALIPLGLSCLAFFLYAPTLSHGFINYDDTRILLGQPRLFDVPSLWTGLKTIFSALPREEPLLVRDLSWLIDSQIFGFGNPIGPHLGNVLLYALLPGLLFRLLRSLGFGFQASTLAASIFAFHPVHVEPVAWVMGRKDVLSAAFFFGSILAWATLTSEITIRPLGRYLAYLVSLVLTGLTLLSKINGIGLPGILLLVSWLRIKQGVARTLRQDFLLLIPHFALAVGIFVWYSGVVSAWGLLGRGPPFFSIIHLKQLLTLIPAQVVTYAELFFIPWDYGIFYDEPAVGIPVPAIRIVLGWLSVTLAVGGAIVSARRNPVVTFSLFALLLTLAPYMNLVYIGIINANRYLLIPSAFGCGLAALAMMAAYRRRPFGRALVVGLFLSWLVVSGVQLVRWIPAWVNNESIWRYEMTRAQPSLLALQAHVRVLVRSAEHAAPSVQREARLDRAVEVVKAGYRRFKELKMTPVEGYYNYQRHYLAKLHQWEGRILELRGAPLEEVIKTFERAYEIEPLGRLLPFLLGTRYAELAHRHSAQGTPERAEEAARKSLAMVRDYLPRAESPQDQARMRLILARVAQIAVTLEADIRELKGRVRTVHLRSPGMRSTEEL